MHYYVIDSLLINEPYNDLKGLLHNYIMDGPLIN